MQSRASIHNLILACSPPPPPPFLLLPPFPSLSPPPPPPSSYPQMILDGDDNLAVDGVRVKPGDLKLWPNSSIAWTKERHRFNGNIGWPTVR